MASSPAKVSGSADRCAVDPTQGRRAAKLWIGHDPLELPVTVQCDSGLIVSRRLVPRPWRAETISPDRKSTRLNSSHGSISYAVFCLKKKKLYYNEQCMMLFGE